MICQKAVTEQLQNSSTRKRPNIMTTLHQTNMDHQTDITDSTHHSSRELSKPKQTEPKAHTELDGSVCINEAGELLAYTESEYLTLFIPCCAFLVLWIMS